MEPLVPIRKVMTWLCMYPDDSISKGERIFYAVFTFCAFTFNLCAALTSVSFVIKYLSTDFSGCLYAIFQIGAFAPMINVIIAALNNRYHIKAIFTNLSKLYAENRTDISFGFFAEANIKSEKLWSDYCKYGLMGFFLNVVVSTGGSLIHSFHKYGNFKLDHLYKPHKQLLPWNQHTIYGYVSEVCFSTIAVEFYLLCNGIVLVLFTSLVWHHQAFSIRFLNTARKLDQPENMPKANEILYELLSFHISVKDWFLKSVEVYSPFVLIQLIYHVMFMAAVVFELDLRLKYFDFELFLLLNAFPVGISTLFVYCYFGKLATESYEKMAMCMYNSSWYKLTPDLQRKALLMLQNMQKPIYYNGFGVAVLNLETFVKFIKTIFTMYMTLKTLSSK